MNVHIITNHHRREPIYGYQLTTKERAEFDYLDWTAEEDDWSEGEAREFIRYKGGVIDLGDLGETVPNELTALGWNNYKSDSFYSGLAFRWVEDFERVIVGTAIFA